MDSHSNSASSSSNLPKIIGPLELLSSSWDFFKKHWNVLVPIAILPSAISYVGSLILYLDSSLLKALGVILSILGAILYIVMIPALINTIHNIKTEHSVHLPLKEIYKRSFKFFWWFILIAIINALIGLGSSIFLIIPAIVIGVYGCFYIYTFVLEDKKGFAAFTESYSLVYHRWWPVFGRVIFISLVTFAVWAVIGFILGLASKILGIDFNTTRSLQSEMPILTNSVFSGLVNIVATSIYLPVSMIYTYQMYKSLKAHKIHNVSTEAFKKWIIAFMVIGIILIPVIIGGSIVAATFFKNKMIPSVSQSAIVQDKIRESIEKALIEQNTPEAKKILDELHRNQVTPQ